jgi:hypothetical protein
MGQDNPAGRAGFVVENAAHRHGELAKEFKLVRWGW